MLYATGCVRVFVLHVAWRMLCCVLHQSWARRYMRIEDGMCKTYRTDAVVEQPSSEEPLRNSKAESCTAPELHGKSFAFVLTTSHGASQMYADNGVQLECFLAAVLTGSKLVGPNEAQPPDDVTLGALFEELMNELGLSDAKKVC